MGAIVSEIRSGDFGDPDAVQDYRSERLGEMLVERVIWGPQGHCERNGRVLAAPGYVWFRFWLPRYAQVVERYYMGDGKPLGTQIDVCMPIVCDNAGCRARDLLLDLWIDPDGRVVLLGEAGFEDAIRSGDLSPDETSHAEQHLRVLTAAISQDRFPPPFVRNWQVDRRRIDEVAGAAPSQTGAGVVESL
jgi:predicted RNA-binding protein associated with RNAse of E/G family